MASGRCWCGIFHPVNRQHCDECGFIAGHSAFCSQHPEDLTPSADLPACRDEDPAHAATLAAAYPDPPEYQHPEEPLEYTEADRAYDRDAFARDYGLRDV